MKKAKGDSRKKRFKIDALKLAVESLQAALEWTEKHKDVSWALVNAQHAVKLLEIAREV
jgi:hypothetical protein